MAKETITRLIDDLDGGEADETVKFGLDGVQYEIDLSKDNAAKLREALQPYVKAGSAGLGRHGSHEPASGGAGCATGSRTEPSASGRRQDTT